MSELASKTTKMCGECAREFEIPEGHVGRPFTKCPACRGSSENSNGKRSSKPTSKPVVRAKRGGGRRAARVKSPAGNGHVSGTIAALEEELEQLDARRSNLEDAIASLKALS